MESSIPAKVGRYLIVSELGRGAMGAVYRGTDPKLDRTVAIKMISAAMAGGDDRDEILARFEREARVSAKLQHPNVVAVYDVGAEGDDLYLVMELVEGETLGQRMQRTQFPNPNDALDIIAMAADALGAAHEAGIIHRDVKPGNLMLTKQGVVKVADFGVAKAVGEKTDLTRTGMMVGSPAYMSPEQVKGMSLDGRSDLFSLGVVLYEMILHRKPFPADTVTTLVYQILHEDPMKDIPIPDTLSTDLAEFMRWTMAKDREQRIPDARSFAQKARAIAAGKPLARPDNIVPDATAAMISPVAAAAKGAAGAAGAAAAKPAAAAGSAAAPRSKAGMYVGIAAGVAVLGIAGALLLGRSSTPPAPEAPAEVLTVEETLRPEAQPAQSPPSELTFAVPDKPAEAPAQAPTDKPKKNAKVVAAPVEAPPVEEPAAPVVEEKAPEQPLFSPPGGVAETYEAKRTAQFHVRPGATMVTINGARIGKADDWDGTFGGKTYTFPGDGDYYAELTLAGYQSAWVKISIKPGAKDVMTKVRTKLQKIKGGAAAAEPAATPDAPPEDAPAEPPPGN